MPQYINADELVNALKFNHIYVCGEGEIRTPVGQHHITEMRYHAPVGEGDRHFVDVYYNGQLGYRDFNFTSVEFGKRGGDGDANGGMG